MTLRKVKSGDPLVIPAETFNTFIDAALDFRKRQTAVTRRSQAGHRQSGIILVKNASGADRQRFHILGLGDPLITPEYNEPEFLSHPAFEGLLPEAGLHALKFAILTEPVKVNAMGSACLFGITPAKVKIAHEYHEYARIEDGLCDSLVTDAYGPARILWREPGAVDEVVLAWVDLSVSRPAPRLVVAVSDPDAEGNLMVQWLDSDGVESGDAFKVKALGDGSA